MFGKYIKYFDPPRMDEELKQKYLEYLKAEGNVPARLRQIGYSAILLSSDTVINNLEEFKSVISNLKELQIHEMKKILKKCFKTYLKKNDLIALLKTGKDPLTESEIKEACRIMPLDVEDGIHVDDFVSFLYS